MKVRKLRYKGRKYVFGQLSICVYSVEANPMHARLGAQFLNSKVTRVQIRRHYYNHARGLCATLPMGKVHTYARLVWQRRQKLQKQRYMVNLSSDVDQKHATARNTSQSILRRLDVRFRIGNRSKQHTTREVPEGKTRKRWTSELQNAVRNHRREAH